MSTIYTDAEKRHDILFLFDVTDGNPNGDPDNENLPRTDQETGQGLVTDVCIKRKVRNYIKEFKGGQEGFGIYIGTDRPLNAKHEDAHKAIDPKDEYKDAKKEKKREIESNAQTRMCASYFDVRAFGAVMTTGEKNCGQVRGPVQVTFSRSIDRVNSHDVTITRQAVTTSKDFEAKDTEMGRKALLSYGLYMGHIFFNPMLAQRTNFKENDLAILLDALQGMFDLDHSASRGLMSLRGIGIFTHDNKTGHAPSHKLFDLVKVQKNCGEEPPRFFRHYDITKPNSGPLDDFNGVNFTWLD